MKGFRNIRTAPIVMGILFIIAFPYIRRVYRRIKNPPKLGIIALYPPPNSEKASNTGVEIPEETFE